MSGLAISAIAAAAVLALVCAVIAARWFGVRSRPIRVSEQTADSRRRETIHDVACEHRLRTGGTRETDRGEVRSGKMVDGPAGVAPDGGHSAALPHEPQQAWPDAKPILGPEARAGPAQDLPKEDGECAGAAVSGKLDEAAGGKQEQGGASGGTCGLAGVAEGTARQGDEAPCSIAQANGSQAAADGAEPVVAPEIAAGNGDKGSATCIIDWEGGEPQAASVAEDGPPPKNEPGAETVEEAGSSAENSPSPARTKTHRRAAARTAGVGGNGQAVFRDRRGQKRRSRAETAPRTEAPIAVTRQVHAPAQARLRLVLHPIQRTARLSLVLSRPEGFPERISIEIEGRVEAGAYDGARYDDIDLPWTPELLDGELRYESGEGWRWLRSARRVQIVAGDANEADLISVSAVRTGAEHAVICRSADAALVEDIARLAGSPALQQHEHWRGIPEGWRVLSGYVPARAVGNILDAEFRPLDPGFDLDIRLVGGLEIRSRVFAEGHPPRIEIPAIPEGVSVSIGGERARKSGEGAWEAAGWDARGQHVIDIVPGPSLTYEIAADPAEGGRWPFWDAHEQRSPGNAPWSCAAICGAAVRGPSGETVIAHEPHATLVVLAGWQALPLAQRPDANVSVGLCAEPPEFLIAAWGSRREQGRVVWFGSGRNAAAPRQRDAGLAWAQAVGSAASRKLRIEGSTAADAKAAWQDAIRLARNIRRRRR